MSNNLFKIEALAINIPEQEVEGCKGCKSCSASEEFI